MFNDLRHEKIVPYRNDRSPVPRLQQGQLPVCQSQHRHRAQPLVRLYPGRLEDPSAGWRSRFDKSDETATPGYYSVLLKDYDVFAELTATPRVGFQRFTFRQGGEGHILVNVGTREGESGAIRDAWAACDSWAKSSSTSV